MGTAADRSQPFVLAVIRVGNFKRWARPIKGPVKERASFQNGILYVSVTLY